MHLHVLWLLTFQNDAKCDCDSWLFNIWALYVYNRCHCAASPIVIGDFSDWARMLLVWLHLQGSHASCVQIPSAHKLRQLTSRQHTSLLFYLLCHSRAVFRWFSLQTFGGVGGKRERGRKKKKLWRANEKGNHDGETFNQSSPGSNLKGDLLFSTLEKVTLSLLGGKRKKERKKHTLSALLLFYFVPSAPSVYPVRLSAYTDRDTHGRWQGKEHEMSHLLLDASRDS